MKRREVGRGLEVFDRMLQTPPFSEPAGAPSSKESDPRHTSTIQWQYGRPHAALAERPNVRCALVGSGALLAGRGLGPTIDAHDLVLRVNRLPFPAASSRHVADVGARTSVWFSKMCRLQHGALRLQVMDSRYPNGEADPGPEGLCPLGGPNSKKGGAHSCPFDAFVARGGANETGLKKKCYADGMRALAGRRAAAFPIGLTSGWLFELANQLHGGTEASTGLHAVLAFAPQCAGGLRLYGFSGNATLDGHKMGHAVAKEHAVINEMARRSHGRLEVVA